MLFYIAAYAFIAVVTACAVYDGTTSDPRAEQIASIIAGAMWPLLFTVRVIGKILK